MSNPFVSAVLIGIGATLLFDLWTLFLARVFGIPFPNWALVGRWFAHLPRGRLAHANIAETTPVGGELAIGWVMHYLVGISFAGIVLAIWGAGWAATPTLIPALVVGLATVGCGWFILQPAMGAGIASSKKPNAGQIRLLNILGHTVFGFGLYGAALLLR